MHHSDKRDCKIHRVLSVTSPRYQCSVYAKLLSGLKSPRMMFRVNIHVFCSPCHPPKNISVSLNVNLKGRKIQHIKSRSRESGVVYSIIMLVHKELVVQAICAQKNAESGKNGCKDEIFHNVRPYGNEFQIWGHAKKKINIFTVVATFVPPLPHFWFLAISNWLMTTKLVSNIMFSGSGIPMEPFKIQLDQYYSGITHVYHRTTLYLTLRDIWKNSRGMTLAMFQIWT